MSATFDGKLTWIGHSTFLLETGDGTRVLLEGWVDSNPVAPDRLKGDGLGHVDAILLTHGHGDHVGDTLAIQQRTGATIAGMVELVGWLGEQDAAEDKLIDFNKGGTIEVAGLKVTMTDAKAGLSAACDVLTEVDCPTSDGTAAMWITNDALEAVRDDGGRSGLDDPEPAVLLPGFDEYMLGYGDRSAMLDPAFNQRICPGNNGMFQPTIVADGTVLGTWKRTLKKATVDIVLDPFVPLTVAVRGGIDAAAERYARFHGRDARVSLAP